MPVHEARRGALLPDEKLQELRIPFVRKAILLREGGEQETFLIDIGLQGVFVEAAEPLRHDERLQIRFSWPGSEVPFQAHCRVAWWHADGAPLASKSLPPGAGLQFTELPDRDRERLREFLVEYCHRNPGVRRFLRHWPEAARQGDDPTSG